VFLARLRERVSEKENSCEIPILQSAPSGETTSHLTKLQKPQQVIGYPSAPPPQVGEGSKAVGYNPLNFVANQEIFIGTLKKPSRLPIKLNKAYGVLRKML
jgi:hypothetical protein